MLNAPKDKDNKEAAEALAAHLDNPGAWPLERDDKCEYVRFGLPRLPIWLNFSPETQTATANQVCPRVLACSLARLMARMAGALVRLARWG